MKSYYLIPLLLIVGFISTCGSANDSATEEELIVRPVRYATIGNNQLNSALNLSGVAQADRQTNLSFRVGGTVRGMRVKLGDKVRRGQLIATLDPIDYSIQADQAAANEQTASANLVSAESQLANARANYQRIEQLYENNSVPLNEFEQAKLNFESAQASFDAQKAQLVSSNRQLQSARNQVSYTRLVAPFNGVISAVEVEVNELIGSGAPIVEISSDHNLEVSIGVPENIISEVREGQKVGVRFSVLPDQEFPGTVRELSFISGNATTYPAIIRLDDDDDRIRPGMAATVSLVNASQSSETHLICPVAAVGQNAAGEFVYTLLEMEDGNYQVKQRNVELGELLESGFEIQSGLSAGELVATAGLRSLLDNMIVKLVE